MAPSQGRTLRTVAAAIVLALLMLGLPWLTGSAQAATGARIDLRVLVVTNGDAAADPSSNAIATQLDREGVPYTLVNAAAAGRPTITAAYLADASTNTAHFQAVVVPNHAGGSLTAAEVTALTAYERQYGIRQVDAYTAPAPEVGLATSSALLSLDGGTATVAAAGASGPFSYLAGSVPIDDYDTAVSEVPGYLSPVSSPLATGETFTPMLTATTPGGGSGVLVGVDTRDNRDEMVLTGAYNPSQLWWSEIAHGVVTWMTRGIHLGYQRNWFNVQVDDIFLPDSRWSASGNCTPGDGCVDPNVTTTDIRMTPADVANLVAWQQANDFKLDMVFNGGGSGVWAQEQYALANPDADTDLDFDTAQAQDDPLRDAFLADKSQFEWINHTWTHQFLGCIQLAPVTVGAQWTCAANSTQTPRQDPEIDGAQSGDYYWASTAALTDQIKKNQDWAVANQLPNFDPTELVTGEHSGLLTLPQQPVDNPFLGPVDNTLGIAFTASDNSRETNQRTVQGGSTLTVPRYPMNVFYNAGTYLDEVDEYNWIYVSRDNTTEPGGGVCDDNPTTSTCIQPLPAATEAQAQASFDSYIKPLEIRSALSKITANSPRPFYAHQSNLAEKGILYPVVDGILAQYRAAYNATAPIVQSDLTAQGTQLQRMAAWATNSASTDAYLDDTGVHISGPGQTPVTLPAGATVSGATLASYGGEQSAWTTGPVSATVPGRGGYVPAPLVTVLGAPTDVAATPGNGTAAVTWNPPATTAGSPLNAYIVTVAGPTGTPGNYFITPDGTGTLPTSYVVSGLTNGTQYSVTVTAQDSTYTQGPASSPPVLVTPQAGVPAAPTAVTATAGNASATVSWTPGDTNGGNMTGFVVNAYAAGSTTAAPVTQVPIYNATSTQVTGLTNGTAYTFTVAGINTVGTGAFSAASSAVTPATTPGAPTIATVSGGNASASVTWSPPTDTGGSPITGWQVQAFASGSTTPAGTAAIGADGTSATVTGLTNGTTYTLTVAAQNALGTGTAATSEPVTPVAPIVVPGAPTITGTTTGDTQVTVTWTPPGDGTASSITGYTVTAYPSGGTALSPVTTAGATATSAVVTGLTNGSAYTFTVTGMNGTTAGQPSARSAAATPVAPTTVPGAPGMGTPTAGDGTATVTWTAPADGGSAITGYTVTVYTGDTVVTTAPAAADALSLTVHGLTNGTAYSFTVTAKNANGDGTPSARSAVVTPVAPTAPGAPAITSVTAGDATATLTWSAPTGTSSPVTGYTVRVFEGSATTSTSTVSTDAATLTATLTGLTNGTAYSFTVAATSAVGEGAQSVRSNPVTPAGLAGAPTIGTAVPASGAATVSWTAPGANGGSAITGYLVSVFAGTSSTPAKTVQAASSASSLVVTGLTNGTAYTFTVAAVNAAGTGPASAASAPVTPTAALALPGAPTIGAVTVASKAATVNWTAPAQTGTSALTGYTVTVYSGTGASVVKTVKAGAGTTSVAVTGLTNGTAYTFTVAATNASGTGPASDRSAAVTPAALPGAPRLGTLTAGTGSVTVAWTAPGNTGGSPIAGYVITVYTGSTAVDTVPVPATPTSSVVSGLTNGTAYRFTVAAVTAAGTGPATSRSSAVTPTVQPGAPTIGTATPGNKSATVTWTAPAQAGSSAVTGYVVSVYSGSATTPSKTVTAGRNATKVTVSGLTNGTAYSFTVAAVTRSGTGAASERSGTVTPAVPVTRPNAPTIRTATAGNASATVAWTAPKQTGGAPITSYVVSVYRNGSGTVISTVTVDGTKTQATVTGLVNGTRYSFRVAAVNSGGTSQLSSRSNAVTPKA